MHSIFKKRKRLLLHEFYPLKQQPLLLYKIKTELFHESQNMYLPVYQYTSRSSLLQYHPQLIHPFTNFAVSQQFHLLFFWQNSCYIHEAFQFQEPLHLLFQDTIPCIFYEDYNAFLQRLYH